MNGEALQLLVFDMGHVLVDFDWEEICDGFVRASKKSRSELLQTFHHCSELGYESGKIDTPGFLAELNRGLGTELTPDQFTELWVATFCENEEMAELLSILKESCPLYLLSNTNELHFDHLQDKFNIARHFEELILSYQVGCVKPHPSIYQEVLRRSGLSARQCLFVDDLELNIDGARAVGLRTIHFQSASDLRERLSDLGFRI